MLNTCKIYISELLANNALDGETNVVKNNLKLVFKPRTKILGIVDDRYSLMAPIILSVAHRCHAIFTDT